MKNIFPSEKPRSPQFSLGVNFFREKNLPVFFQEVNLSHLLSNGDFRGGPVGTGVLQADFSKHSDLSTSFSTCQQVPNFLRFGMTENTLYRRIFPPWAANSSSLTFSDL